MAATKKNRAPAKPKTLTKSVGKTAPAKAKAKPASKTAPAKPKTVTKPAPKAAPARSEAAPKKHRVFSIPFASVYPMYVQKAEKKGRTKQEVDQVIAWLTGYRGATLQRVLDTKADLETFFAQAPRMNPNAQLITGVVCGVRVENVTDPLMQQIRYLDKLVDELAHGKKMESILRD